MARVLVLGALPEGGDAPLAGHTVVRGATDVDAAAVEAVVCPLTEVFDAPRLAALPNLRAIGNIAVGYDNIDVDTATARGVAVCNTPGVLDEATADLAFALVLMARRRLSEAEADVRAGRWTGWSLVDHLGLEVHGATLGLVGYGRIGRAVARRAEAFGMAVLHHTRTDTGEPGWVADLDELLSRVDVVSLHVPLTPDTHHLLDRDRLARMRPDAVLVNTARGAVVDEEALADALEAGRLYGAGLDVYEGEPAIHPRLLAAPHVALLPHVGSATVGTRTRMAQLACESVVAVLRGEVPANCLNPQVLAGR